MCAAISRSKELTKIPVRWADGAAELGLKKTEDSTALSHLFQSDPCRTLFPRPARNGPFEGVFVTTSGGLVGGDRLRFNVKAAANTQACVTSQAAEKIYRSVGQTTEISISLDIEAGATLEWMPQETILFDGARIRRHNRIDAESGSKLLTGEIIVFGRTAFGERVLTGHLYDSWRVYRNGSLVWADALHMDGALDATLSNPYTFDGAVACATLLFCADDAADILEGARTLLTQNQTEDVRTAATCVGPTLIMRFLSSDTAALRQSYAAFWSLFRNQNFNFPAVLPRVWES